MGGWEAPLGAGGGRRDPPPLSGAPPSPPAPQGGLAPISIIKEIEEMEEMEEIEIIGAAGFQLFLFPEVK